MTKQPELERNPVEKKSKNNYAFQKKWQPLVIENVSKNKAFTNSAVIWTGDGSRQPDPHLSW